MPTDDTPAHSPRLSLRLAALLGSLLLLALAGELALRFLLPAPAKPKLRAGEPVVQEPDPVLGWKNKAGRYEVPPYSRNGDAIRMRFLADGRRASSEGDRASGVPLLLLGGSFAQGWAISDDETLAWKLQRRFAGARVLNYGTGGYGSYQSLLVMERELPPASGAVVLYAFTGHHTTRNVAPWSWMRLLSQMSVRGHIDVPYATIDASGALTRHPPERFRAWPLGGTLRIVDFLQTRVYGLRDRLGGGRSARQTAVTEGVLREMQALAESRSAHFAVAILSARRDKAEHFGQFLDEQGIPAVDCNSFPLGRHQIVIGEGHPNGAMNSEWARCVGDFLAARFGAALDAETGAFSSGD